MPTANEQIYDLSIRHLARLQRLTATEVRAVLKIMSQADVELTSMLDRSLRNIGPRPDFRSERWREIRRAIRSIRTGMIMDLESSVTQTLRELVPVELDFESRSFRKVLPQGFVVNVPSLDRTIASVLSKPFSGGANSARTLNQWFEGLAGADQSRIIQATQLGMIQGETVDEMVRRIRGTRKNGFKDGVLSLSRRNAEAIVRTSAIHVSNDTRQEFWNDNEDIIRGLYWDSVLDGRTSSICQSRDRKFAPNPGHTVPDGMQLLEPQTARPPAHPNCRSAMIPLLDGQKISDIQADRPFVRTSRRTPDREKSFREQAKQEAGKDWKRLSEKQRRSRIKAISRRWADQNIGKVPARVSYEDWLRRQPKSFQTEVLGVGRSQLFRKGMSLDKFVNKQGQRLTLKQLAALEG